MIRNILNKLKVYLAIFVVAFVGFVPSRVSAWVASGTPLSYSSFASGINYATQIDTDTSGNVYVSGYQGFGGDGVAKYNSAGTFQTSFGAYGSTGVAVDPDGNVLVVDYQNDGMEKYTNTGTPIDISGTDLATQVYSSPYAVATDSFGNIYVANAGTNEIFKFNSSLAKIATITGNGISFNFPESVAVDSSDNLYVLDSGNNRVQKFNSSGTWQLTVTGNGGAFNYPESLIVDTNGNIYVGDSGNNRIQIFDTSGVFQQEISSSQVNVGTGSPLSYLSGMGFQNPNTFFVGDDSRTFKIIFDHDDPTVSINALAGNDTTDSTPTFTGTTSDSTTVITNVEYSIDSGAYSACTSDDGAFDELTETYSCTVSPEMTGGAHTVDVRGTDSKSNTKITNYAFTATLPAADSYTYEWTKAFQGNGYDYGAGVDTDSSGNIYSTGYFESTVDFDPGASVDNHTSLGSYDIFLTKINSDGSYGWTKTFGNGNVDNGNSVTTDASGNIYITGYFTNTVDFDSGALVDNHSSNGSYDIFVTKYNADGSYGWTKTVGGSDIDIGNSVTVDFNGNIYTTGYYSSIVDFDPSIDTDNHSFDGTSDIFLTKYNSDGSYGWTKTVGGLGAENAMSVSTNSTGIVYVAGYFESTTDFDPSAGTDNLATAGGRDIFVSEYNSDGSYGWTKRIGGTGFDFANSVTLDSSDNIIITGPFESTVDFNPGAGTDNHTSSSGYDFYITKLNSDGSYGWTKTIGGSGTDFGNSVTTDSSDNIYTTGYFSSTVDFDPGAGTVNRTSIGGDAYITSYSTGGSYRWVHTVASDGAAGGASATYDLSNNSVYVTGDFGIVVDFNPLGGGDVISTDSSWDAWVMKLGGVDPALIVTPSPSSSPTSSSTSTVLGTTNTGGTNTSCSALPPDSAPNIFKISRAGNQVDIFFSPISSSNILKYQLMYGYKPADERFAVTIVADESTGAIKYSVNDLVQSQAYSFWMRGMNDCMPGPWSNTYSIAGQWVSPDASPVSSTGSSSDTQPSNGNGEESSAPTEIGFEITVVDPLGLPLNNVLVSIAPSTENIPSAAEILKDNTKSDGIVNFSLYPGEYTITTTYNDDSYSQGMILSATSTLLNVKVPIPLRDSLERQLLDAPIDASYAVKAGIVGVVANSALVSLVGLLVGSNVILSTLIPIYSVTSRSFLRLPLDYLQSIIKLALVSMTTKLAQLFPGLRRKKKSNGLVFDAFSSKPLQKAYVILFSASGNLKTAYTDEHGRYNFGDIASDDYQLRTEAAGYKFPSTIITTSKTNDIEHVYLPGEILPISQDSLVLNELAIPMDPNDSAGLMKKIRFGLARFLKKMVAPSYLFSVIIIAFAVYSNPSQLNQIVTLLFGSYLLVKANAEKHYKRMSGVVQNPSKLPIVDAQVKLFKTNSVGEKSSLYTTTKTDKNGRYYLQPEIGNYILEILTITGDTNTQTVRIMKNVPTVDRAVEVKGLSNEFI